MCVTSNNLLRLFALLGAIFFVILGSACSGSSSNSDNDVTSLRVVHVSPDAPDLDTLVDDLLILNDLSYSEASSYLAVNSGNRGIKVNLAATDTSIINTDATFSSGQHITLYVTGRLSENNIEQVTLFDRTDIPAPGQSLIRVLHAAPSAPAVDIYVGAPGDSLSEMDPLVGQLPYRAFTGYEGVFAGAKQIRVTIAGTLDVVIDSGEITLDDGQIVTVVARDGSVGAPFELLILDDLEG